MLREGMPHHPDNPEIIANYALSAQQRANSSEALARWTQFKLRFPDAQAGYACLGVALRELNRFDEADTVLREGLARFPDNAELIGNYAWVAYNRRDWLEALKRWTAFRDRFPEKTVGHYQVMLVLGELGQFEKAVSLSREAALSQSTDPSLAALMLEFESLGENCEFGVVQRHYGAEPLGLLRFTATRLSC